MKLSLAFFCIPLTITLLCLFIIAQAFSPTFNMGDFRAQYAGGYIIKNNKASQLYNLDEQLSAQQVFLPTLKKHQVLPFYSPPVVALLLSPLAHFPFAISYIVFGFSQLVFLGTGLAVMSYSLRDVMKIKAVKKSYITRWHLLFLISGLNPIWMSTLGQLAAVWMLVVSAGWVFFKKGWHFRAGLILSLLVLKLHLIIIPLYFFAVSKKWNVVKGVVVGSLILGSISIAMVGINGAMQYAHFLIELSGSESAHGVSATRQTTLFGYIAILTLGDYSGTHPTLPPITIPIWIVSTILVCLWVGHRWIRIPNSNQHIMKLKYAHMLTIMMFTSLHTHAYDMSILFFAFILYIDYILSTQKHKIISSNLVTMRYRVLLALTAIALITLLMNAFTPFSIICYLALFYLIEKEYGKIHKAHETLEKK